MDAKYRDLYPQLAKSPDTQNLYGMITHTDEMVGDIVDALNVTGRLASTVVVFSADNGGPGGQDGLTPRPSRFDTTILERNSPYRGQKHEIYEGGVRVAGLVFSPLLPRSRQYC